MAISVVVAPDGKHELSGELVRSQLYNKDLAPAPEQTGEDMREVGRAPAHA